MKIVEEMPIEGSFVAVWLHVDGRLWSRSFYWLSGSLVSQEVWPGDEFAEFDSKWDEAKFIVKD